MNRTVLLIWIFGWPLSLSAFGQQESNGLLIYQDPASSHQEAIEYRSIRRDNPLYSTLVSANGERKQLKTAGVVGILDYPPPRFDDSFPDLAHSTLDKIQVLERQFPPLQRQLEMTRGKWDRALSVYDQSRRRNTVAAQNAHTLPGLNLKAAQYANARLISATHDSATIAHDNGVTKIPLKELTVPQIVSLNATSDTTQLGTTTAFPDNEAGSSKSWSISNKINAAGVGALAFVASRTGIGYDTLHAWLLFVIFPGLILAMLVVNIAKARKARASSPPKPGRY
jgi:hypothetical protein